MTVLHKLRVDGGVVMLHLIPFLSVVQEDVIELLGEYLLGPSRQGFSC
jgi:hypothetical protein